MARALRRGTGSSSAASAADATSAGLIARMHNGVRHNEVFAFEFVMHGEQPSPR
jgi:hypothetical protein